jgi:hypothetical protein
LAARALTVHQPGARPLKFKIGHVPESSRPQEVVVDEMIAAIRKIDGIELDEHYTGPAMLGLRAMANAHKLRGDTLFWNTKSRPFDQTQNL